MHSRRRFILLIYFVSRSASNHQSHFEQYGSVDGTVSIDGTVYSISTRGLRDHTIGARRDWNDFERYVLHFIQLENGDGISIGVICAPIMFTRLIWPQPDTGCV